MARGHFPPRLAWCGRRARSGATPCGGSGCFDLFLKMNSIETVPKGLLAAPKGSEAQHGHGSGPFPASSPHRAPGMRPLNATPTLCILVGRRSSSPLRTGRRWHCGTSVKWPQLRDRGQDLARTCLAPHERDLDSGPTVGHRQGCVSDTSAGLRTSDGRVPQALKLPHPRSECLSPSRDRGLMMGLHSVALAATTPPGPSPMRPGLGSGATPRLAGALGRATAAGLKAMVAERPRVGGRFSRRDSKFSAPSKLTPGFRYGQAGAIMSGGPSWLRLIGD